MKVTNLLLIASLLLTLPLRHSLAGEGAGTRLHFDFRNPPQGLFFDEWMEIRMQGQKIGYSHQTYRRTDNHIHTRLETFMKISRGPIALEMETTQGTVETLQGSPIRFEYTLNMASQPVTTKGRFKDGKVYLTSSQHGDGQEHVHTISKDAKLSWGSALEGVKKGFKPGTAYTLPIYSPEIKMDQPIYAKVKVKRENQWNLNGKSVDVAEIDTTLEVGGVQIATTHWTEKQTARILKTQMDMMGMPIETSVVSQEQALRDFIPAELFVSQLIELNAAIPKEAQKAAFLLTHDSGSMKGIKIPEIGVQSIVKKSDTSLLVNVLHGKSIHSKKTPSPLSDEVLAEYLEGNLVMDINDAKLRDLAQKAGIEQTDTDIEKAHKLRQFTSDYILEKGLNVGFATASEVARTPAGDCSEHAVFLAALGRIHNIPTRVVSGLAYLNAFGGKSNVMGYHMWTQYYADGHWIDIDAALEESVCAPTRIALSTSSLNDHSLAEIGLSLYETIGQLKVELVSVE